MQHRYTLAAFDVGGSKIQAVIFTEQGHILAHEHDVGGNPLPGTEFLMVNRDESVKLVKAAMKFGKQTYENAMEQIDKEVPQLYGNGIVQTQLIELGLDDGFVSLFKIIEIAFDRHLPEQNEYDRNDNRQRDQRRRQTLQGILQHKTFTTFSYGAGAPWTHRTRMRTFEPFSSNTNCPESPIPANQSHRDAIFAPRENHHCRRK